MPQSSESRWLADIATGRAGWIRFYKELLHQPISNPDRFWTALDIYGQKSLYEAVINTAIRRIEGDPLNYVIGVARSMWRTEQDQIAEQSRYYRDWEQAKTTTAQENDRLADKIRKARETITDE